MLRTEHRDGTVSYTPLAATEDRLWLEEWRRLLKEHLKAWVAFGPAWAKYTRLVRRAEKKPELRAEAERMKAALQPLECAAVMADDDLLAHVRKAETWGKKDA